jgi:hypothetical protein
VAAALQINRPMRLKWLIASAPRSLRALDPGASSAASQYLIGQRRIGNRNLLQKGSVHEIPGTPHLDIAIG